MNGTLVEMAHWPQQTKDIMTKYWVEVVYYSNHPLNLVLTRVTSNMNPFEKWWWRKLFGRPCRHTTSLKNNSATCTISLVFLHGMKCSIVENISTTTNIESCPFCVICKPRIMYTLISSHGLSSTGKVDTNQCYD